MDFLILVILVGFSRYGYGAGIGIGGILLVVLVIHLLVGHGRF
jgi:hypothetical protein